MPSSAKFKLIFVSILLVSLSSCRDSRKVESTDFTLVSIPRGTFDMGSQGPQASQDEGPVHKVSVAPFYIMAAEVTNEAFAAFVKKSGYKTIAERKLDWDSLKQYAAPGTIKPHDSLLQAGSLIFKASNVAVDLNDYSQWWEWKNGADWQHPLGPNTDIKGKENYPVVHIAWEDANVYCRYYGMRLPTEAEWEWASRGGLENPMYPWGNEPVNDGEPKANFWQGVFPVQNDLKDGHYRVAPVRSFPANGYGLFDMAGNVWEWCADRYHAEGYQMITKDSLCENPKGPLLSFDPQEPWIKDKRVLRGGSFLCNDSYCSGYRVSRRMRSTPDSAMEHTGFRCVADSLPLPVSQSEKH